MRFFKKGTAFVLVLVMLMPVFPASFAEEGASDSSVVTGEIIYNLGNMEITVGNDADKLADEDLEGLYNPFESDGSYTIELEENAFFPYEVQFKGESGVKNIWFDTLDSTVEFEGHTFRVHTIQNDPEQFSQIGINIGGDYIPVRPEEKEFTNHGGSSTYTLLPIAEFKGTLDLSDYLLPEVTNARLETVVSAGSGSLAANDKVAWAKNGDRFEPVNKDEPFDLRSFWSGDQIQLIVGSAAQLDQNNKRYTITVTGRYNDKEWLSKQLFEESSGGSRTEMKITNNNYSTSSYSKDEDGNNIISLNTYGTNSSDDGKVYVGLNPEKDIDCGSVTICRGLYKTEEAFNAAQPGNDVTSQIWNGDISGSGGFCIYDRAAGDKWSESHQGVATTYGEVQSIEKDFTMKMVRNGRTTIYPFKLKVTKVTYADLVFDRHAVSDDIDYISYDSKKNNTIDVSDDEIAIIYLLYKGFSANGEYYFRLGYSNNGVSSGVSSRDQIKYAVVGRYTSETDVKQVVDSNSSRNIKDQLFPTDYKGGYKANYSNGVDFTIVDNYGKLFNVNVKAEEGDKARSGFRYPVMNNDSEMVSYDWKHEENGGNKFVTYSLYSEYPANSEYNFKLDYYNSNNDNSSGVNGIKYAVVGKYGTAAEIEELVNADSSKDIKFQLFVANSSSYDSSRGGYKANYSSGVDFSIVDNYGELFNINVKAETGTRNSKSSSLGSYYMNDGSKKVSCSYYPRRINDNEFAVEIELYSDYPSYDEYNFTAKYTKKDGSTGDESDIKYAVVGKYASEAEVENIVKADGSKNIKAQLFTVKDAEEGYKANYHRGVDFTIVDNDGTLFNINVKAETGTYSDPSIRPVEPPMEDYGPHREDAYFTIEGADGLNNTNMYIMPFEHDSYYYNGYQTVFINDSAFDLTKVKPKFNAKTTLGTTHTAIYASINGSQPAEQFNEVSELDFSSGKAAQYTVAGAVKNYLKDQAVDEHGTVQANYWVSFIKKHTGGAKLFVNGANVDGEIKREVFLDSVYSNKHDIFIANVGDQKLTGLKVELLPGAKNIKLDDYWTVGGDKNSELAPFDSVSKDPSKEFGELFNVAKIRLLPADEITDNGDISGTLVISADGQAPVSIKLTGKAGDTIITTKNFEAVKYVPFSGIIQNNNMYKHNTVTYSANQRSLPEGLTLYPNGELYGVPQEAGTFTFSVRMDNSDSNMASSSEEITLTVKDNTDENVDGSTDQGYDITTRIPDMEIVPDDSKNFFIMDDNRPDTTYEEFIDVWLDGEKLTENVDYDSEEGSTKITVRAQTFKKVGNGKHTIAAEFRKPNQETKRKDLKRSAQNFYIGKKPNTNTNTNTTSNRGNGSSREPSATKPVQPPKVIPSIDPAVKDADFTDIFKTDWFYEDVKWAYDKKYMLGVGNSQFAPAATVNRAMTVTVLARLAGADPAQYVGSSYQGVEKGMWYTNSVLWAKETGITINEAFNANGMCKRGHMALMLKRYLDRMNVQYTVPDVNVNIADADKMTAEELQAFETLAKLGIFKGKSDGRMDPDGMTKRSELAALLHRVYDTVK